MWRCGYAFAKLLADVPAEVIYSMLLRAELINTGDTSHEVSPNYIWRFTKIDTLQLLEEL